MTRHTCTLSDLFFFSLSRTRMNSDFHEHFWYIPFLNYCSIVDTIQRLRAPVDDVIRRRNSMWSPAKRTDDVTLYS